MKENTMGYSDEWQPYKRDYDKFEYDIKLKDGTVVENCYPNGGEFNSISDEHNGQSFSESDILEIRFSSKPRFGINENVSNVPQYEWLDKQSKKDKRIGVVGFNSTAIAANEISTVATTNSNASNGYTHKSIMFKNGELMSTYNSVEQYRREEPKIQNNSLCSCGSGKKYKKCCKFKK